MADVLHADIFFFISSIATVILSILLAIALYYAIRILHDVRNVTEKIRKASDDLEHDFDQLRESVKGEGVRVKTIVELVLGFIARQIPKPRSHRKSRDSEEKEGE